MIAPRIALTHSTELRKSPCRCKQTFYPSLLSLLHFPAYSKPLFINHIIHHFNLGTCISVQSGLAFVFYRSHSQLRDALKYRKFERHVYRILLFTLCAPSGASMYKNLNGVLIIFHHSHCKHTRHPDI